MKEERYIGQIPLKEIQESYFLYYNPNYWLHKANAIISFIEKNNDINLVKFKGDRDTETTILNHLKMDLHMMVFHSTESLFLNILSIVYQPTLPWIWICRCSSLKLFNLITQVKENGLGCIKENPEEWLHPNLYPTVKSKDHQNYDKSIKSVKFVVKYLERLSLEFIEHDEYNSFKHGLRCFPGQSRLTAIDDQTKDTIFDSGNIDTIDYLIFEKTNEKDVLSVSLEKKHFNYKIDYQIVMINTIILYNMIHPKKIMITDMKKEFREFGYYFLDNWNVNDLFINPGGPNSSFKKFKF
jgi:hypothetical protein